MAFQGPERRLRARFRVRVPFLLKGNEQEVRGTTRNISLLGISAYTHAPLNPMQPVQCLLELPEARESLVASGTVIRCEPLPDPHPDGSYETGVFFKGFPSKGEQTLAKFLDRVSHQEEAALRAGYRALREKMAARKRKKRLELLHKRRQRLKRLRRKKLRLARQKRQKAKRLQKGRKRR